MCRPTRPRGIHKHREFPEELPGKTQPQPAPAGTRWRRSDHLSKDVKTMPAGFLDTISIDMKEFHIPPVQIKDILPQHLVLLKAAKGALTDAGIQPRPGENDPLRTNIGCAMGISFDFGATDFSLRWKAHILADDLLDQ
ncbi:MAG: beta-ketoacyl synthase N-terminal-like domain-containing protein, partial [Desulfotignum sp.]